MSKKITEKLKEMLTPGDLKILESAIEKMINQRVTLKEEELKNRYDELAEEYVAKKISEGLEVAKAELIESYDGKLKNIEQKVVTKLGSFLDHVIVEQISESAIEKLAINEVAMPVVEQIKKIFGSNYIDLDTDGSGVLRAEQKKSRQLKNELTEAYAKIMESEERLEKASTFLLISEKTDGLARSQKQRVANMFKSKKFDDTKENIDTFVDMVKESKVYSARPKSTSRGTFQEVISEGDSLVEQKASINEEREEFTFAEKANRYI